ncbi:MAG: hypothetical protein E6R08_09045 [Nevskiaceae bacterium]|nr:MAG: hypothetical protein E6R08_09045 [Nevskiaceae bacterium]
MKVVSWSLTAALLLLGVHGAFRIWLYNWVQVVESAHNIPSFLIDKHYTLFTDSDVTDLRKKGALCQDEPVMISPARDGTLVMVCGLPIKPQMRIFTADEADMPSFGLDTRRGAKHPA